MADEVLGVGAMEVDISLASVGVLLVEPLEPEDTGQDGVVTFLSLPNRAREAALEAGLKGSPFANFFADAKVTGGRLEGAFFESRAVGSG